MAAPPAAMGHGSECFAAASVLTRACSPVLGSAPCAQRAHLEGPERVCAARTSSAWHPRLQAAGGRQQAARQGRAGTRQGEPSRDRQRAPKLEASRGWAAGSGAGPGDERPSGHSVGRTDEPVAAHEQEVARPQGQEELLHPQRVPAQRSATLGPAWRPRPASRAAGLQGQNCRGRMGTGDAAADWRASCTPACAPATWCAPLGSRPAPLRRCSAAKKCWPGPRTLRP